MDAAADVTCDVLLIRHLPGVLSITDQIELLKHFGAVEVKCVGNKGPLKYCAFAKFDDVKAAQTALKRLHQFNILGHTLCVEFSKKNFSDVQGVFPQVPKHDKTVKETETTKSDETPDLKKVQDSVDSISQKWSARYPFNPKLCYSYPPPSLSILTNITNALATIPKFYVQVLHLMNKMNLPAPFGVVTPAPPIPHEPPPLPKEDAPLPKEPDISDNDMTHMAMEVSSTEESELETDSDTEKMIVPKILPTQMKRKKEGMKISQKKIKLSSIAPVVIPKVQTQPVVKPDEVFDQPSGASAKKMGFKFGQIGIAQEPPTRQDKTSNSNNINDQVSELTPNANEGSEISVEKGGFGKIAPISTKDNQDEKSDDEEEEEWGAGKFISSRQLRRGRLSSRDMKDLNVFKNYNPGEPTTRLYIKNVAKQTSEKDLHYIFGRYVNWENNNEKNMFDIRLMKEGRMKGQCFITLGSEKQAQEALNETNGFQLNGKPMVVQFARSAKPKATPDKVS